MQSQGEMLNVMKTKQVDFTFPFQVDHKIDDDGLPNVTLIRAFVSFGSSLVANLKKCEVESEETAVCIYYVTMANSGLYDVTAGSFRDSRMAFGKNMELCWLSSTT